MSHSGTWHDYVTDFDNYMTFCHVANTLRRGSATTNMAREVNLIVSTSESSTKIFHTVGPALGSE